jgi:predicted RND superfamily exporter protein
VDRALLRAAGVSEDATAEVIAARLAKLTTQRPGRVLLCALALSAALLPLVLRIRLDTDVTRLVPQGREEAQAFARFARSFTAEQVLIVLAESDEPAQLIDFAEKYSTALRALPEVAEVRGRLSADSARFLRDHLSQLLTVDEIDALAPRVSKDALVAQAHRLRGLLSAPGGSSLAPILTADPLELLPIVQARLSSGLPVDTQSGWFRSADGRALMLYVRPHAPSFDIEADRALIAAASRAAASLGARVTDGEFAPRGLSVSYTGACAYALYYRDWLHRDASLSTPISALAVLILFALFFRSLRVLPLVAIPLGAGLLWTAAAAYLLYGRVNAVSLTFGTVLLSIGIDFPIQIYNRLREHLQTMAPRDALERTMRELAGPSLTATLGPAIVFFACAISDYRGLADLGILAGIGLVLNLLAMLTVLPSLLAFLPPRWWAKKVAMPGDRGALYALGALAGRRPRATLLVAALAGVAAIPLALRLHVEERLITIHPPSMPPVKTEHELSHRFGERENMLVALIEDKDRERALERSDLWTAEAEKLRKQGLLRGYQSASSLFPSQKTQAERRAHWDALGAPRIAEELRAALVEAGFDVEPFAPFLDQLAHAPAPITLEDAAKADLDFLIRNHVQRDGDLTRAALFLFVGAPAPDARLQLYAVSRGPAGGVLTGAPVLEEVLRAIVVRDTVRVTALSIAGVFLLLAIYYRRWRPWIAVVAPLALAWIGFFAALAALGLPLNLFNLLAVPLVIGYGIDDHVFLVHRHAQDPDATPARTVATTGRAIMLTSLATVAGFAGLGIARFPGLKLFGISGALAVAFCLIAAFAVLPALLNYSARK